MELNKYGLWAHQEQGVAAVLAGESCLWMGMRTGKTRVAIAATLERGALPALVLCPVSAMEVWRSQLIEMGVRPCDIAVVEGTTKKKQEQLGRKVKWLIVAFTSYWRYPMLLDRIDRGEFKTRIIDESHRIANPTTKQTAFALLHSNFEHSLCLSGSPRSEGLHQLAPQYLASTHRNIMGHKAVITWLNSYATYAKRKHRWQFNKKATQLVEDWVRAHSFTLHNSDLNLWVPQVYTEINLPVTDAVRDLVRKHRARMMALTMERDGSRPREAWVIEHMLLQGITDEDGPGNLADHSKIDWLVAYLKDNPEMKVLVFAKYRKQITALGLRLRKEGIVHRIVQGETPPHLRDDHLREFKTGSANVLVSQSKVFAESRDISEADTIVYLSNDMSQWVRAQSEERGNKVGRTTPVEIIDLVLDGTSEQRQLKELKKKVELSEELLQGIYAETDL